MVPTLALQDMQAAEMSFYLRTMLQKWRWAWEENATYELLCQRSNRVQLAKAETVIGILRARISTAELPVADDHDDDNEDGIGATFADLLNDGAPSFQE